ncbi:MAG: helix-turn-helix domain-containing protein [Clostridiales bacterium]|uniref:helix-turn-helix domain-containing protein n=1 Tax=Flavonifractor porci TaxID=3133422 RepID=UPI0030B47ED1|nr:helix-turn-helix domain-containing protein [Clostridiales bacterium]
MDLTERLAQARKARGLSQAEAAERLNVSRQAISRWETGTGMPTLDNLIQMGKLYQVSLDELVYGVGGAEVPEELPESEVLTKEPEPAQTPKRRRPALLAVLALVVAGVLALGIWGSGLITSDKGKHSSSVIVVGGVEQDWDKLPLDRAGEQVGPFGEVEPVTQELGIHVLEDTEYRSGSNFSRDIPFVAANGRYLSVTVTNNGTQPLLFQAGYLQENGRDMLATQIPVGATVTRTFEVLESGGNNHQPRFGVDISTGSGEGGTVEIQISAVQFKG